MVGLWLFLHSINNHYKMFTLCHCSSSERLYYPIIHASSLFSLQFIIKACMTSIIAMIPKAWHIWPLLISSVCPIFNYDFFLKLSHARGTTTPFFQTLVVLTSSVLLRFHPFFSLIFQFHQQKNSIQQSPTTTKKG